MIALLALAACEDHQPPTLSLTALDRTRPLRGSVELAGEAADPQGLASLTLTIDGADPVALPTTGPFTHALDTAALPDGVHLAEVVAVDGTKAGNRVTAAVAFATDNTPPALEIGDASPKAVQGGVLAVFVRSKELLHEPKVRFLDKEHPLWPLSATTWRALIGVSVKQDPGTFPLTVVAGDEWGNVGSGAVDVVLAEGKFVKGGFVKLSAKQEETQKDDSKQQHDRDIREAAWAHVEPRQLWAGRFVRPAEGEVSSEFGKYREYSSGVKNHHLGLDVSNEPGTPIHAAADGEVLVAESLFIMGNHVIIGHGQGVASAYSHLTDIAVKKGQEVQKGELVGTMGSTGQSTGPHLHWEVVVGGNKIGPEIWEAGGFDWPSDDAFVPLPTKLAAPEPIAAAPAPEEPAPEEAEAEEPSPQ
jgi:murein DD-endopeptidase MepM/ murein hydrolase activator NlpD